MPQKAILMAFTLVATCSLPCSADPFPGLVRAIAEIDQANDTFVTIADAVDDAKKQIKPSSDFSAAAQKYETAATDVKALKFPPQPTLPTFAVGPVTSCANRLPTIATLSSAIADVRQRENMISDEIRLIASVVFRMDQALGRVDSIEKAIPVIAAIPIWGDGTSAQLFTMTQKVRKAIGDASTPLNQRVKQDNAAYLPFVGLVNKLARAQDEAKQFSNAPTPSGSYARSCNSCSHDCYQLTCSCRRVNGSWANTNIFYNSCRSVANLNGTLSCGP